MWVLVSILGLAVSLVFLCRMLYEDYVWEQKNRQRQFRQQQHFETMLVWRSIRRRIQRQTSKRAQGTTLEYVHQVGNNTCYFLLSNGIKPNGHPWYYPFTDETRIFSVN